MNLFREAIRTRDRRAIVFLFVVGTPPLPSRLGRSPSPRHRGEWKPLLPTPRHCLA